MSFQRPGRFHWAYQEPYEQAVISDGETLWIFDKDLEQVTVRAVEGNLNQTPIMLLNEPDRLQESFDILLLSDYAGEIHFGLTPKNEDAGFKHILLIFSDSVLVGMEIQDAFDQFNRLTFHNVALNRSLEDELFQFTPPEGVDIIHATEGLD